MLEDGLRAMTSLYIYREFSSTGFEMAMKRDRQGSDYSDLLDILSLKL
jgi:hypothetical protein